MEKKGHDRSMRIAIHFPEDRDLQQQIIQTLFCGARDYR